MKLSLLRHFYRKMRECTFCMATLVSPTLNTKLRYRYLFKKSLNLKKPETFNEKLLWLKLKKYNNSPLVVQCADKYRVRDYVRTCGYEDLLVDLIGKWDSATEIPWEELPNKFVLKWNFGAGMNVICEDKALLNRTDTIKQMEQWGKKKYWLSHSEMQYKSIPKKIICEKYLDQSNESVIPDYKIYCFHGNPQAILVLHNRGKGETTSEFFDVKWRPLDNANKYSAHQEATEKPACLEKMLEAATVLAAPFPFVRCDFYVIGDRFYFGELTFTPAGGMYVATTKIGGKDMADFLNVPE